MTFNFLPVYQCHKKVQAAKILKITDRVSDPLYPSAPLKILQVLHLEGDRFTEVDGDWYKKHSPKVGGYYVVYDDGYRSYSPADAFESGYTLIEPQTD